MQFLSRYSKEETDTILKFMQEFNVYLDEQIEQYITDSRESTESRQQQDKTIEKYNGERRQKFMEKKPFVTKEQLDEIVKKIPRHHFIYMMKKAFVRMRKQ